MWMMISRVLIGSGLAMMTADLAGQRAKSIQPPQPLQLVASPRLLKVDAERGPESTTRRETFTLHNPTASSILVATMTSSCTCVRLADKATITLGPGETRTLGIDVDLPKLGVQRTRLVIRPAGDEAETIIYVEAKGTGMLPVVVGTENPSPIFFELRDVQASQSGRIKTWEPLKALPWLTAVDCSNDCIRCSMKVESEVESISQRRVERSYIFTVGWNKLPNLGRSTPR